MLKVILTKGLPGSGKSTWAKQQLDKFPGRYKRVNKDDLRLMLDDSKWSSSNEKFVLRIRDEIILNSLLDGKHIIVDDTNLSDKHERRIKQLIKENLIPAQVIIQDFTDVPVKRCIENDLKRDRSVGKDVIMKMHKQFLEGAHNPTPPEYNPDLSDCIIVDIDGTIATKNNRSPFDWDKVDQDYPKEIIINLVNSYAKICDIILFSGRDGCCLPKTVEWLRTHRVKYTNLRMRNEGDQRKDTIVKRELYDQYIKDKYNVKFVLDDRNQVVDMWRKELGLICLQVDYGDF